MNNPIMQILSNNNLASQLMQLQQCGSPHAMLMMLARQYPELLPLLQGELSPAVLEQFCRTSCQQRGLNFDEVLKQTQTIMNSNSWR